MNEFVVYCPKLDQLVVFDNYYSLDIDIKMGIIRLGLKNGYTLEYVGEL